MSWGTHGPLAEGSELVTTDAELRHLVSDATRHGRRPEPVGVLGGDLCRTVGGAGSVERLRTPEAVHLPVDVGAVLVDGRLHHFVAHLVARRRWWHGEFLVAMNAQWLGDWDLGPRSHPGDGRLDLTWGSLPWTQRIEARRRARTGDHLPHPKLTHRRLSHHSASFDRPIGVWLDGERVGEGRDLVVRVEPSALTIVV
jgi:diacylglycerol kinase family enzyme